MTTLKNKAGNYVRQKRPKSQVVHTGRGRGLCQQIKRMLSGGQKEQDADKPHVEGGSGGTFFNDCSLFVVSLYKCLWDRISALYFLVLCSSWLWSVRVADIVFTLLCLQNHIFKMRIQSSKEECLDLGWGVCVCVGRKIFFFWLNPNRQVVDIHWEMFFSLCNDLIIKFIKIFFPFFFVSAQLDLTNL